MMTISIIVKRSSSFDRKSLWKALQPRDNSAVILRRFSTNICVCMASNGTIVTERFVKQTVTDNCKWYLRVSRHGMGFEHRFMDEDHGFTATLNAADSYSNLLGSGWSKQLWHSDATWQVLGVLPSQINDLISLIKNSTEIHKLLNSSNFTSSSPFFNSNNSNTSSTSDPTPAVVVTTTGESKTSKSNNAYGLIVSLPHNSHSEIKLTNRMNQTMKEDVILLEAPAHQFKELQDNARRKHCKKIKDQLVRTVQRELYECLKIIQIFRNDYQKLVDLLETNRPVNFNSNYSQIGNLLDKWLMLIDFKRRHRIRQMKQTSRVYLEKKKKRTFFSLSCTLSIYQSSFEQHLNTTDKLFLNLLEKRMLNEIYYGLFQRVQHLPEWNTSSKISWLQSPRLSKLFKYLNLNFPPIYKLKQTSLILHQYIPYYSPENVRLIKNFTDFSEDFHYGLNGKLNEKTFSYLLNQFKLSNVLIDRAVYLKFEEYYFWPKLNKQSNNNTLNHTKNSEYSIFVDSSLREAIRQLKPSDICYKTFIERWSMYRERDSDQNCIIH